MRKPVVTNWTRSCVRSLSSLIPRMTTMMMTMKMTMTRLIIRRTRMLIKPGSHPCLCIGQHSLSVIYISQIAPLLGPPFEKRFKYFLLLLQMWWRWDTLIVVAELTGELSVGSEDTAPGKKLSDVIEWKHQWLGRPLWILPSAMPPHISLPGLLGLLMTSMSGHMTTQVQWFFPLELPQV